MKVKIHVLVLRAVIPCGLVVGTKVCEEHPGIFALLRCYAAWMGSYRLFGTTYRVRSLRVKQFNKILEDVADRMLRNVCN